MKRTTKVLLCALAALALAAVPVLAFTQPAPQPDCAQVYRAAGHAIDSVYGIVPGVDPKQQLDDSTALYESAMLVQRFPDAATRLCSVETVADLQRLTLSLDAVRNRLDADGATVRKRQIEEHAAVAVQDIARWLPKP